MCIQRRMTSCVGLTLSVFVCVCLFLCAFLCLSLRPPVAGRRNSEQATERASFGATSSKGACSEAAIRLPIVSLRANGMRALANQTSVGFSGHSVSLCAQVETIFVLPQLVSSL